MRLDLCLINRFLLCLNFRDDRKICLLLYLLCVVINHSKSVQLLNQATLERTNYRNRQKLKKANITIIILLIPATFRVGKSDRNLF